MCDFVREREREMCDSLAPSDKGARYTCLYFLVFMMSSVLKPFHHHSHSKILYLASTDHAYVQFLGDDFLRLLLLRYVFCYIVLILHRGFKVVCYMFFYIALILQWCITNKFSHTLFACSTIRYEMTLMKLIVV